MNQKEINEAIERYNRRLDKYGVTEEALGWGPKGRAKFRYEILLQNIDVRGKSIIDVGCGYGILPDLLLQKKLEFESFTGVDINPEFVKIAREKFKDYKNIHFRVGDVREMEDLKADYVLSSGIFNHKLEDNMSFIQSMFDTFHRIATRGFASNFLSDRVDYVLENTFHSNPAQILEMAYKYSRSVILRNDYMPFEFTVSVSKDVELNEASTVYKTFEHLL